MNSTDLLDDNARIIRCHHYGLAVKSIENCASRIASVFNGRWNGVVIEDPLQCVKVSFISIKNSPDLELVEPLNSLSPIIGFLKKGSRFYHVCYEVDNIRKSLEYQQTLGGIVVGLPKPAIAFSNRQIAWVFTKDQILIELLSAT